MSDTQINIELWIGNNMQDKESYNAYFYQSDEPTNEVPSKFCMDLQEYWLNPEFLDIPKKFKNAISINDLLDHIKVNRLEYESILDKCLSLGLEKANSCFWYVNRSDDFIDRLEVSNEVKNNDFNGLKYIGRFNANEFYTLKKSEPIVSKSHLWIGTTNKSKTEYKKYFKLDYKHDLEFEKDKYIVCQFCKDTNINWYDEDFIAYPDPLKKEVSLEVLLEKILHLELEYSKEIIMKCHDLGIDKANAIFWYKAEELEMKQPFLKSYNDLQYIGQYEI